MKDNTFFAEHYPMLADGYAKQYHKEQLVEFAEVYQRHITGFLELPNHRRARIDLGEVGRALVLVTSALEIQAQRHAELVKHAAEVAAGLSKAGCKRTRPKKGKRA